jgi:hypothetical protein
MKRVLLMATVLTVLLSLGCSEAEWHRHALGTRVHTFTVNNAVYTHCSILMSSRKPEMINDAIKECQDAVQSGPQAK